MTKILPHLTFAKPLPEYELWVEFEDGVSGKVSLKKWKEKGGVFSFWNDENQFRNIQITDNKKIQWSKEIDMDPDSFYLQLIGKTFEEYAGSKQFLRHSH
ncbi:MAG TPA: DUF2442 domain-containing protein [Flavipsychrobacter sp.]|nr:DUF2442 domain-containing protein [Flavipsychrobacter sp.]